MNLVTLQIKPQSSLKKSLKKLLELVSKCEKDSFILAPELALSGYSYENLKKAAKFSSLAIKHLKIHSRNNAIALTLITSKKGKYFNTFYLFHKGEIIHTQSKVELFKLNDEGKYFTRGKKKDIKLFSVGELKVGTLICFELRFKDYWQKLEGADIILVPAMWGKNRKDHYETLCKALAIANQCFVIASDSSEKSCAKGSSIITPFGEVVKNDNKKLISSKVELNDIKRMRKYLNTGIK